MIRHRKRPDGLPFRVYEYRGTRVYSIGYKAEDGTWSFRLRCPATDESAIKKTRREAIRKAAEQDTAERTADDTFAALAALWLARQHALPHNVTGRRAESTLAENAREIAMLNRAFGRMKVADIEKADAYTYLDACELAVDKEGKPRPRAAKGNKEIALAHVILEYGVRTRWIKANPFARVEKLETEKYARLVTDQELALAVEVGRLMPAPQHIVALALRTAWLCVRRSVEVRGLTRDMITEDGIVWTAAKRQRGEAAKRVLIEWSPELRATIAEAQAIQRNTLAGSWYLFGNLDGQRYTKGGWKATLAKLMAKCVEVAAERRMAFQPFSLQDCRPMAVTEKEERGDADTMNATAHTSERMIRQTYDRRATLKAKPTR